jgi:hypothetical protein
MRSHVLLVEVIESDHNLAVLVGSEIRKTTKMKTRADDCTSRSYHIHNDV